MIGMTANNIVYPTFIPLVEELREFKYCQKCGLLFTRRLKLARVHVHTRECVEEKYSSAVSSRYPILFTIICGFRTGEPDRDGVLKNTAPPFCPRCYVSPLPEPPLPTEVEEAARDEKLKWRRRGGDHANRPERTDWVKNVARARTELKARGKMTASQLGKAIDYKDGAVAVRRLIANGLELRLLGTIVQPQRVVGGYYANRRVRQYALAEVN